MGKASDYWDNSYENNAFSKGKGPDPFVEKFLPRLQKGKLLEIGMGEGQNAVFCAQKGFEVRGFDISQVAVDRANELASSSNVKAQLEKADLDLFILGLMEYDSILMMNFKPPVKRYYSEIIRALKQGGTLLVKSLMDAEMTEAIGPDEAYRNYFFHTNELLKNISGLRILYYNEDKVDGKKVIECLAQKPMDRDAAKYNLFNMQSEGSKDAGQSKQRELAEALFKKD